MADNDVLQAIQIIDDKIASLQAARNQLAQAFGIESKSPKPVPAVIAAPPTWHPPAQYGDSASNGNGHKAPSGRKVELAKFLAGKGATDRATIIAESGLPEGTISYCLNDKRFFEQAADGKWAITEYSRRGLERGSKTGTFQAEAH
jgi:hypothetical protein